MYIQFLKCLQFRSADKCYLINFRKFCKSWKMLLILCINDSNLWYGQHMLQFFSEMGKVWNCSFSPERFCLEFSLINSFTSLGGHGNWREKTIFLAFQYTHKIVRKPSKSDLPLINSHVLIQDLCNLSIYCAGFHDDLIMPVT